MNISKGWKTEIELFVISQSTSYFTFANIFKFCSIGSEFTKNDDQNDKLFVYFEKLVINEPLFGQSFNEYLW